MTRVSDAGAERLLHDLVAIASPSCQEAEAARFLTAWMRDNGYDEAFVDEAGNAVGRIGSGARQIVLLGHIDTFAGFPPVRQEGRLLYGRGAVDAKGPLCTFAVAASRANLADDASVIVLGAVEEEAATSRGAHFALSQYQPDYCVIGEPSRWDRITLAYKGRLLLDWRWEGGLSHSAGEAPSPAERALSYWNTIRTYCDKYNEDIGALYSRLDGSIRDINTWQEGVNGVARMTSVFACRRIWRRKKSLLDFPLAMAQRLQRAGRSAPSAATRTARSAACSAARFAPTLADRASSTRLAHRT